MSLSLNGAEETVLRAIMLHYGPAPVTAKEAIGAALAGMTVAASDVRLALRSLLERGEIRAYRKSWGDPFFAVPFDRCLQWAAELAEAREWEAARIADGEAESDGRADGKDLALDLLVVLDDMERKEPKVLRNGRIDKKSVERWSRLILLSDQAAAGFVKAPQMPYPANVAMMLDLLLRTGMVRSDGGLIRTDPLRIKRWVKRGYADFRRRLYESWLRVWCPDEAELRLLAMMLPHFPADGWTELERLPECFAAIGLATDFSAGERGALKDRFTRFLGLLAECGWLETGLSRQGGTVFRPLLSRREASRSGEPCYVQSDLDVVVPPGSSYEVHRLLLKIANPPNRGQTAIYRISRDRAQVIWRQGWTGEGVLAELERWARHGIPDAVRRLMSEWERAGNGLRLEPAVVLRFRDRAMAEEIASLPDMQPLLGPDNRLPDGTVVLAAEQAETVRKLLGHYGYDVQKTEERSDSVFPGQTAVEAAASPVSSSMDDEPMEERGLFRVKYDTGVYQPVERVPDARDLFPGLEQTPPSWLDSCRRYHPSTAADIVRRALEWQCYVKVRTAGGERLIAPLEWIEDGAAAGFRGLENGRETEIRIRDTAGIQIVLSGADQPIKFLSKHS